MSEQIAALFAALPAVIAACSMFRSCAGNIGALLAKQIGLLALELGFLDGDALYSELFVLASVLRRAWFCASA
jgi:hypothetical protein